MDITIDLARYAQISNSNIAYIAERGSRTNFMDITCDVDVQGMTVAIECASIASTFCPTDGPVDSNIGLQASINPILAIGLLHFIAESFPVVVVTDRHKDDFGSRGLLNPQRTAEAGK